MSAVKETAVAGKDLVVGLGPTEALYEERWRAAREHCRHHSTITTLG